MQTIHQQVIHEIQQIPAANLVSLYDIIRYFRLGLTQKTTLSRESGGSLAENAPQLTLASLAGCWEGEQLERAIQGDYEVRREFQ